MSLRENFDLKLKQLNEKVLELGGLAENAFVKAITAMENKDIERAIQVIDEDSYIDHIEEEINDLAIILIAREAPVAVDLRRIIVAIKIASDLERVADYAVNIAKSVIRIGVADHKVPVDSLLKMSNIAKEMLSLSFKAFIEEDVVLAKKIADTDDEIDKLYGETIKTYLQLSDDTKQDFMQITQLSFIARYIERIGDYATNISEGVFYIVKGVRYELNN
ncbi:phosphate uptake regulator, PhoU [Schinkia azotoformans MEV2011]|uniref:Phosphate-specific transport system accessory protein PhoU n=1 Tax=Schinkia azotoformans MEV2011 TaxID=1348973 RepID=A0A072NM33_SCHAZ|nr:phosphate signaling complex protein PhoU [Schinkia azotoformans]KEF38714.1 phosphate uptake regulator, PhoU [Schinkia azotoformans MEV2011]